LSQFSSVGSPGAGPFSYRAKKHKAKLSRENELEADRLAVEYMINAGYEKKDYLNFLKWMKSNLKDAPPSDLATHPPIQKRITRVEQLNTLGFSKTNNTTLIKPQ
jgi:predicted Zn-dependent protease